MRHVVRTQRVDIDWLFERVRNDPGVFTKYVRSPQQMVDLLRKASFTPLQWKALCCLCSIGLIFGDFAVQADAGPGTLKGRKPKPLYQRSAGQLQGAPTPTVNLIVEKKRPQAASLPLSSSYSLSSASTGKKLNASSEYSAQLHPSAAQADAYPNSDSDEMMKVATAAAAAVPQKFLNTKKSRGEH